MNVTKIGAALLFGAALAGGCNTSTSGANERISFTPENCGQVLSCDLADSIAAGGKINITIDSLDGTPTAGLDLASRDPDIVTVEPAADIGGAPSWELTAHAPGVADLAALDGELEIDFVEVPVQELEHLGLEGFVGDAVGPAIEDGFDEAWTVNADTQVSWFVRPMVNDAVLMGRFSFETVTEVGLPDVTDFELDNSDRPNGHLSVMLPPGDYPVEFQLSLAPDDIYVSAIIHAVATGQ